MELMALLFLFVVLIVFSCAAWYLDEEDKDE